MLGRASKKGQGDRAGLLRRAREAVQGSLDGPGRQDHCEEPGRLGRDPRKGREAGQGS
jgi:hypothetical protein